MSITLKSHTSIDKSIRLVRRNLQGLAPYVILGTIGSTEIRYCADTLLQAVSIYRATVS